MTFSKIDDSNLELTIDIIQKGVVSNNGIFEGECGVVIGDDFKGYSIYMVK